MRILVGISWGVDSAVSAYMLQQQWHQVVWGFMLNYLDEKDPFCTTKQDLESFYEVCRFLAIPYEILDFRNEYKQKVLHYIYEWYLHGITPNPDVLCNTEIKFRLFLDEALKLWYDRIATGHYARVQHKAWVVDDEFVLLRWVDTLKDQSYFLAGLDQFQLSKALFPIGGMLKSEVRRIAQDIHLPNATRKDSQWLCFVGDVRMSEFLKSTIGPKPWDIVLSDGTIVWQHDGAYQYTIWQRKGLKLHFQAYVTDVDVVQNVVVVSPNSDDKKLYRNHIRLSAVHRIGSVKPVLPLECRCKIRYRQNLQNCRLVLEHDQIIVYFEIPQKWVPNGQICVLYGGDGFDEVLGCGEIRGDS